jgi:D-beta-D-heptose 7-phosphate kinase/D-beta-D-heptose 1-phosphate adenosyltransferase
VTGAGDTVLATMAYFIASGLTIEEACELANHAAAIVIRRVGSATTTIEEIIADIGG